MAKAKSKPREQAVGRWGLSENMWYHFCEGRIKFLGKEEHECIDCDITLGDVEYWDYKSKKKE